MMTLLEALVFWLLGAAFTWGTFRVASLFGAILAPPEPRRYPRTRPDEGA